MTKEEAIKILNEIIDEGWLISDFDKCIAIDACQMAINALEKEPCDDAVSRQAVSNTIFAECSGTKLDIDFAKVLMLQRAIKALPPITPTKCIATVRFNKEDLREICNERIEIECTHGTCKDCINHGINKDHTDIDGARYCSSFHTYTGYDFYCADFEKRSK